MNKLHLIDGIYEEMEIICMSKEYMEALGRLLNDIISENFIKFFKEADNLNLAERAEQGDFIAEVLLEKIEVMKQVWSTTILKNTFHKEVANRGLIEFVKTSMNIDTILEKDLDRNKLYEDLRWLSDNRNLWNSKVTARSKDDFLSLVTLTKELELNVKLRYSKLEDAGVTSFVEPPIRNLTKVVEANRDLFYRKGEQSHGTGMSVIENNADKIQIVLNGLEFEEYCNKNKLSQSQRRRLL